MSILATFSQKSCNIIGISAVSVDAFKGGLLFETALIFFLLANNILAQITLLDADDNQYKTDTITIKKEAVEFQTKGAQKRLNCQDIVEINLSELKLKPRYMRSEVMVILNNGDSIIGEILSTKDETLKIKSPTIADEIAFKFSQISCIQFLVNKPIALSEQAGQESDLVVYTNASVDKGSLSNVSSTDVSYHSKTFDKEVVKSIDEIACIYLAQIEAPPEEPNGLYAVITTKDGSIFRANIESVVEGILTCTDFHSRNYRLALSNIASIYFKNGRVIYLSDLEPSDSNENANYITIEKPLPSDLVIPFKKDRNAKGLELSIRGKQFKKGIGVHARSALTYKLNKQFKKFYTTVGVDDCANDLGNVIFKVFVDGKVAYDSGQMTGKDPAKDIALNIENAGEIKLVVEFGEDANISDWADWANARVIR